MPIKRFIGIPSKRMCDVIKKIIDKHAKEQCDVFFLVPCPSMEVPDKVQMSGRSFQNFADEIESKEIHCYWFTHDLPYFAESGGLKLNGTLSWGIE
jgi:hypothetical protein